MVAVACTLVLMTRRHHDCDDADGGVAERAPGVLLERLLKACSESAMQPQVRMMGYSGGALGFLGLLQGVLPRLQVCWLGGRSSAWIDCGYCSEWSMLVIIEAEVMLRMVCE